MLVDTAYRRLVFTPIGRFFSAVLVWFNTLSHTDAAAGTDAAGSGAASTGICRSQYPLGHAGRRTAWETARPNAWKEFRGSLHRGRSAHRHWYVYSSRVLLVHFWWPKYLLLPR